MKKQRIFAVVMAAVMTLSMVACGGEQTGDVTNTPAPTATTAPTETPAPTEAPAPQNVTIENASITFEDGNMGFVDAYMSHARSANVELSLVDFNGSKALKVVNTTGSSKAPFVAIDASSFLGANVTKVAGVEMVIGTAHGDGKFHAVSGEIGSWWGAEADKNVLGSWSVYMEKKNPKVITGTVPEGNELVADAFNIVYVGMTTDNGVDDAGVCGEFYIDDIRFYDKDGNTLTGDTTVAFNWPVMDEVDYSIYKLSNVTEFEGYVTNGGGWGQNGADFTEELLAALVPGTALEIDFKSADNSMWCVFPDATPGGVAAWTRVAQGQAVCDGETAYITYDQIVAAVGEDKTQWGARLQFEAATAWEVYGVEVGTFVEYPVMGGFADFEGYVTNGGGWGQNGADFTEELLAALVPGSILEISYKSADGSMWIVLPDATPGGTAAWSRVAQGQAICTGDKAYITYEQIAAVVGENQAEWGARLQFEAATDWEVYGIRVGKYVVEETAEEEGGEEEPKAEAPDPTIQVADGTVEFTNSKTFADASWWTQVDVSLADLIGSVDPATVTAIKFTCPDTNFIVGYNDTVSGGWAQFDTSNTYVVKTANLAGTDPIVCLYLSKGDSVEYTISWEVYTGGSTEIIVPEAPAEPVIDPTTDTIEGTVVYNGTLTLADASWWTQKDLLVTDLIGDVDPATVKGIKFTSDTAFVVGYTNVETAAWDQYTTSDTYVVKAIDFNKAEGETVAVLALSKGDGVEYTINWEVYTDGEAAGGDDVPVVEEPVTEEPAADAVTGTFSGAYVGDYSAEWIPADAFAACTDGAKVTIGFKLQTEADGRTNQWWNLTFIKADWTKYLDAKYYLGEAPAFSEYEFVAMEGDSYTFTLSADALAQIKTDGKFGIQTDGVIFVDYSVTPAN